MQTLEQQFRERWYDSAGCHDLTDPGNTFGDQVIFSSPNAIGLDEGDRTSFQIPPPRRHPAASSPVQMWRTIPWRDKRTRPPFRRAEFTAMAGVNLRHPAVRHLIWIFDQYSGRWPLARQLNFEAQPRRPLRPAGDRHPAAVRGHQLDVIPRGAPPRAHRARRGRPRRRAVAEGRGLRAVGPSRPERRARHLLPRQGPDVRRVAAGLRLGEHEPPVVRVRLGARRRGRRRGGGVRAPAASLGAAVRRRHRRRGAMAWAEPRRGLAAAPRSSPSSGRRPPMRAPICGPTRGRPPLRSCRTASNVPRAWRHSPLADYLINHIFDPSSLDVGLMERDVDFRDANGALQRRPVRLNDVVPRIEKVERRGGEDRDAEPQAELDHPADRRGRRVRVRAMSDDTRRVPRRDFLQALADFFEPIERAAPERTASTGSSARWAGPSTRRRTADARRDRSSPTRWSSSRSRPRSIVERRRGHGRRGGSAPAPPSCRSPAGWRG